MFIGDYHTHSKYSLDAKSTLEENIKSAVNKGLKQIAVTEHSFGHKYGIRKNTLDKIISEIKNYNKNFPSIKIFSGIEMDLLDEKGNVDVSKESQEKLDLIVLGFHKNCGFWKSKFSHYKMVFLKNSKQIEKNTDAYIRAMENNKVDIIAHLNYGCRVNVKRIAEYAVAHNKLIEINGRKILFSKEEVKDLIDSGVLFIVDSDAHRAENIGNCSMAYNFIIKNQIPFDRVVNWNSLPKFDK